MLTNVQVIERAPVVGAVNVPLEPEPSAMSSPVRLRHSHELV